MNYGSAQKSVSIERCTDNDEWDEYVLENGGHPLQLWSWGQVKAGHGWIAERYFALEETGEEGHNEHPKIIGAAQVLTRRLPMPFRAISYIPRGPIGLENSSQSAEFLNKLADAVKRDHHSIALSVEPSTVEFNALEGWQRSVRPILPAETVQLDLNKSESDLLAVMAKKTRQYIRKSASEQIEIRRVKTLAELDHVLDIYQSTAKRAGFQIHDLQYYRDIFTLMQDNNLVFASYRDYEPIAFLWIALSAHTAFELYGGMSEQGAELRANYALKWHVIRKAKEWGLETYDFGGLISGGVSVFKQGWVEEETVLAGTFDKPLSPLYKAWVAALPAAKAVFRKAKSVIKKR
jgi:peptidoglycan pentaglycine glycine transferase (the first glycine)